MFINNKYWYAKLTNYEKMIGKQKRKISYKIQRGVEYTITKYLIYKMSIQNILYYNLSITYLKWFKKNICKSINKNICK